jgi:RNA polymerase sigma-70 factor (ECF subfamily)
MALRKSYEDSTLISMLADDSEFAFQVIFERYHPTIYKVSMLYVKSPTIAEEIVQDIFLKLWFQRKNLAEIRSLESWLFILTKNLTLNYLKKISHEWSARQKWVSESQLSENTADYKLISGEYDKLVQQAIDHLPSQQQKVYELAKNQGLTYKDISSQLNISPLTVKTHLARAMASIRCYLEQNGIIPGIFLVSFLLR